MKRLDAMQRLKNYRSGILNEMLSEDWSLRTGAREIIHP
jgi:hypothetical protein